MKYCCNSFNEAIKIKAIGINGSNKIFEFGKYRIGSCSMKSGKEDKIPHITQYALIILSYCPFCGKELRS